MVKKTARKKKNELIMDGDFSTANNGQSGNRVFVSMGKTINIGNYESIRVEFGSGRTVDDGEMFKDVANVCCNEASKCLKEMIDIVEKSLK